MRTFSLSSSRSFRRSSRSTATSAIRSIENVADEIDIEDLIEQQDCAYTLTHFGYIKRQPTSVYRAQRRGGRGVSAMSTREEDFAKDIFTASTHDTILFFSDRGKVYKLKGYQIPETGRSAKGMNIVNLLELENGEKITAMFPIQEFADDKFLFFVTPSGYCKAYRAERPAEHPPRGSACAATSTRTTRWLTFA